MIIEVQIDNIQLISTQFNHIYVVGSCAQQGEGGMISSGPINISIEYL